VSVGLIGFGRLGALLVRYFGKDVPMKVYDVRALDKQIRALGAEPASLTEAAAQDIVIVCVPIGEFESLIRKIKGKVQKDALIMDVCSVKEHPVRVMKKLLPKGVQILATHPNFGPDSAALTLEGRKVAVCKVRVTAERYRKVKDLLESKGLQIVEMTPKEHDRQMASSLVLTHFIGRGLIDYGAKSTDVDTEGYRRLLRILQTVQNDSWQLFKDMNRYNAFAAPMRKRFLKSMRAMDAKVTR
jgi:prephenate dehydrogenase